MVRVPDDPEEMDEYEKEYQRLSSSSEAHKEGWSRTLEDMRSMAEQREEEGYDVITIRAQDTTPQGKPEGESEDQFGLLYVVPGNDADEFVETVDPGDFPEYNVYRADIDGRVFLVTELLDPDSMTAVFIAGNFWRHEAEPLVEAATEADEMHSYLKTLDGTVIGTFHHEGYEQFFPDA
ncbi:MAG: hypothetical protein V5A33_06390 [Halobacteriales archaeon]